jgi:hypothetical protein
MAIHLITIDGVIVPRVAPTAQLLPVVDVTPAAPRDGALGDCEDCGEPLTDCCGDPACGRVFCESCEFGTGI